MWTETLLELVERVLAKHARFAEFEGFHERGNYEVFETRTDTRTEAVRFHTTDNRAPAHSHASNSAEVRGSEMTVVEALMKKFNVPMTRQNYLEVENVGRAKKPDPETESEIPDESLFNPFPEKTHEEVAPEDGGIQ